MARLPAPSVLPQASPPMLCLCGLRRAARREAASAATRLRRAGVLAPHAPAADPSRVEPAPGEAEAVAGRHTLRSSLRLRAVELPARLAASGVAALRGALLRLPGANAVVESGPSTRRLLLDERSSRDPLPSCVAAFLPGGAAYPLLEPGESVSLVRHVFERTYDSFSSSEALSALLPPSIAPPSSFEEAGHVIHLNLREEQRPWGRLIGSVLLDKQPRCRTVVTKRGSLTGPFRTFDFELLAGEARYVATIREGELLFTVDVSQVYWNSRLATERRRLVGRFSPGEGVVDIACGAGPIALAAARKGCSVWACDANPAAVAACSANARANRVVLPAPPFCGDGADFARLLLSAAPPPEVHHVVCNLPQSAPELLGRALRGAFATWPKERELPFVHAYAFSKADDPRGDILARLAASLGVDAAALGRRVEWSDVRDVAPGKRMLRATFRLPWDAADPERAAKGAPRDDDAASDCMS